MTQPRVITLCGSTRFPDAFHLVNMHLTLKGCLVFSVGCMGHADQPAGARFLTSDGDETTREKQALDRLHFRKIELSDGIFVINVGGYIGSSTKREIAYALSLGKNVEYLFSAADGATSITEVYDPAEAKITAALHHVRPDAGRDRDSGILASIDEGSAPAMEEDLRRAQSTYKEQSPLCGPCDDPFGCHHADTCLKSDGSVKFGLRAHP